MSSVERLVSGDGDVSAPLIRVRPEITGQIHPAKPEIIRVIQNAEDRDRGPSPKVRMVFHWDQILALARAIRDAGLYLERNAQRLDPGPVREVNVHVLADILFPVDLS